MRKRFAIGCISAAVVGVSATAVLAQGTNPTIDGRATTSKGRAPTGLITHLAGAPNGPDGRPMAVRKVTLVFPPGTKINTRVPAQCNVSAAKIQQTLGKVCPKASRLGVGSAQAFTGLGPQVDPVGEKVTAFNSRRGIQLLFVGEGTVGQTFVVTGRFIGAGVARASAAGPRLVTNVPRFPLPGGAGEAALTKFDLTVKPYKRHGRSYAISPPCPKSHTWTLKAIFTYDDREITASKSQHCTGNR
ncbi:MAG: hypothetical protein IRZ21_11025 [Thermoleophilaceae bacterium]|nr:hypothetical protein [Thermoleophilaceae bacterium]